jgi:hypothetical protein
MKHRPGSQGRILRPDSFSKSLARLRKFLLGRQVERVEKILIKPLASVLMIHGMWIGLPLWLVVARDFRWAVFAAIGLLLGEAARLLLRVEDRTGSADCLKANAFLTTLAVAWLLPDEGISLGVQVGLVMIAASIAAVLAAALVRALEGTDLPPLVWGYCAVASTLFIIFPDWTLSSTLTTDWGVLPSSAGDWVGTFFRTLGAFFFAPDPGAGAVIAATVLIWSRTMFLAGLAGWIAGVLTALLLTHLGVLFYWMPTAYNFFIAGMALGSVYFLPGWTSLAAAAFAGCIAAFGAVGLQHLLNFSSAAFLPVPLSLTVWVGIGALKSAAIRGRLMHNRFPQMRPEDAWQWTMFDIAKWGNQEDLLMIPVVGEAEITQGFSGPITHAGRWRHALDFQRPRPAVGKARVQDLTFGTPVLAPAPGIVERIQNEVPDNDQGVSNYADNWGNYVVIRLDVGGWALLAHLRQGSVTVPAGARVGFGTVLGEIGNSGRSPVPHLHLQVQTGPEPGEATQPFRLANYLYAERPGEPLANWAAAAVPAEGTRSKAAQSNLRVHKMLAGMSPGHALWSVETRGEVPPEFRPADNSTSLRVDISLDTAGRQVFKTRDGGLLVARFDLDAWRVIELDADASPFLRLLSLAAPCVPYAAAAGTRWSDVALAGSSMGWLRQSLQPYRVMPFVTLESRCKNEPARSDDLLTIQTRLAKPHRRLPETVTCEFRGIEGPSNLTAEFARGSLIYALYSFAPTLPHPVDAGNN